MIRFWTRVAGAWKTVSDVYVKVGGSWREVTEIYTKESNVWKRTFSYNKLVISSNTSDFNLQTAMGSPSGKQRVDVWINSGVIISSTSTNPSFDTCAFAAGSEILITNNGQIIG